MSGWREAGGHRLERLLGPRRFEVSCERCFELLDGYVELELADAEADARISGLSAHLGGCQACRADHEGLLALVQAESPQARSAVRRPVEGRE